MSDVIQTKQVLFMYSGVYMFVNTHIYIHTRKHRNTHVYYIFYICVYVHIYIYSYTYNEKGSHRFKTEKVLREKRDFI